MKTWNVDHPQEEHELLVILSNLREYTYGPFASQVRREVGSVRTPIKPWRWDASCLSQTLSSTQLGQHSEEPPEVKVKGWQKSLKVANDQVTNRIGLKQNLLAARLVRKGEEFLSPPSTPGV